MPEVVFDSSPSILPCVAYMGANRRENLTLDQDSHSP